MFVLLGEVLDDSLGLSLGLDQSLGLAAKSKTAPLPSQVIVSLIVVLRDGLLEGGKSGLVLLPDGGDGKNGSSLLVNNLAESGLALDNAVGNAQLAAESGHPYNKLQEKESQLINGLIFIGKTKIGTSMGSTS